MANDLIALSLSIIVITLYFTAMFMASEGHILETFGLVFVGAAILMVRLAIKKRKWNG